MSKGISGLFSNISSVKSIYRKGAIDKARDLIKNTPNGKIKSVVVGAYDASTGKAYASFAGKIPNKIHPKLMELAEEIGGIGSHGLTDKNIVGVCAEFHVVNDMLNSGVKYSDIKIVKAIRPRTGKFIPFCKNCKTMFKDIIDDQKEI